MKIKNILTACLVCCGFAAAFTSCSKDEDPYFSANEYDAPRILNTDIPEGKGGEPGEIANIERTTNFKFEVIATPVNYTTITWHLDDQQIHQGSEIDMPLLAGNHILKIVATTTKGLSTSRTCKLVVRPAEMAGDAKSRWLTIGTTKTITCNNVSSVAKVFIGQQEATNVSYDNGKLTFDVPAMDEGKYQLTIEDATGTRWGCDAFTVSKETYPEPGIKETVLWEGATDINWGTSNVTIPTDVMSTVPVGATIQLYYELVDMPEGYHAMRITTPSWGDNPEDQVIPQFDITAETPNPFEFTYTDANKAIVDTRGGMLIVGYGYKVTKVTYE